MIIEEKPPPKLLTLADPATGYLAGAAIHREVGATKAIAVFGLLSLLMVYWYFRGYWFEHVYLQQQLWTAAALSLGFSVMKAAALIAIACLARSRIIKLIR